MPQCTIFIPNYNKGSLLEFLLKQLQYQMNDFFKICVIDDNSKIKTQEVNIKNCEYIYNQQNMGINSIRNYCLKKCNTNYLMFIDSDDFISLSYLQKIQELINNYSNYDVIEFSFMSYPEGEIIYKEDIAI